MFWGTVERAAAQGMSFLVVLVLARLLGPADYGLVTLAATIALFGQMLLSETFSQALIQQKTLEPAHISSLFWTLAGAGFAAAVTQAVAADAIAGVFGEPGLALVLRALSLLLLFAGLQAVPTALFKRELDFRPLAGASASGTILGGVLGIGLAFAGFGVWSLVANLLAQNAVTTAAVWRRSPFRPALVFSHPHFRELWAYGRINFLLRIAAFAANQMPRILVGYLFGTAALGAFSLGLRVVEILYQLLTVPAVNVTMSLVAKLRDDKEALERTVLSSMQFAAMASVPVFVALGVIAPAGVPLVFGQKWAASVTIIQLLCVFGVVGSCGLIWGSIIAGLGRPDIALVTASTAALVNVTVLLLAAPFGLAAASAAFVIRGYVTLPFMPIVIARLTGIPASRQYSVYAPTAAAAIAMAAAIEVTIATLNSTIAPAALTLCALILGAAVYLFVLYVLARPMLRRGLSFLVRMHPYGETA